MRRLLAEHGVAQPAFAAVRTLHEGRVAVDMVGLPAVLRPETGDPHRGLFVVESAGDLERHLHATLAESPTQEAILERPAEGVGLVAVVTSGGIELAEASAVYANALREADGRRLDFMTEREYFTLLRATRMIEVAEAALARARVMRDDVHTLLEAGAADSVALLEADLALTRARFGLRRAAHDRREAAVRLATYLGLPCGEPLDPTTDASARAERPGASPAGRRVQPQPTITAAAAAAIRSLVHRRVS